MKQLVNSLVRLYANLLRFYPSQFRATFAEEMCQVFRLAAEEAAQKGFWSALYFAQHEIYRLPLSVMREHLREHRQKRSVYLKEGVMANSTMSIRVFRWCIVASLALFTIYVLLVISPFFTLGLHLQPTDAIRGGMFDPKCLPLYANGSTTGNLLLVTTLLAMVQTPILGSVVGYLLTAGLIKHWRQIQQLQRLMGGIALVMSLSIVLFNFSSLGRLISTWYLD